MTWDTFSFVDFQIGKLVVLGVLASIGGWMGFFDGTYRPRPPRPPKRHAEHHERER